MVITQSEVVYVFLAINQDAKGELRKFQFTQLAKVNALAFKLDALVEDGKVKEGDHDVEVTTDEKKMISDFIKEREWPMGDAKVILGLTEKLDA